MAKVPAISPIGIPITLTIKASINTNFVVWAFVAPIEFKIPNCFLRSLIDIEKALYTVAMVQIITKEVTSIMILSILPLILS